MKLFIITKYLNNALTVLHLHTKVRPTSYMRQISKEFRRALFRAGRSVKLRGRELSSATPLRTVLSWCPVALPALTRTFTDAPPPSVVACERRRGKEVFAFRAS